MPQVPTTPTDNKASPDAKAPGSRPLLVPPEEQFWKRYSPHHESGVSSVTSFTLHVLILGPMVIVGIIWLNQARSEDKVVPNMDSVTEEGDQANVTEGDPRGGGGGGGTKGKDDKNPRLEDIVNPKVVPFQKIGESGTKTTLEDPPEPEPVDVKGGGSGGTRTIAQGTKKDLEYLSDQGKTAERVLSKATGGRGSQGSGGGEGGGTGTGKDKGTGRGVGSGSEGEVAKKRAQRQHRWRVIFNRDSNGEDYRDKLRLMHALLVVAEIKRAPNGQPIRARNGQSILQYRRVIRDIRPNAQLESADVSKLKGIFWIDDKPQSVQALARALGIAAPPLFACFFPLEVEEKLRQLEQARYKGDENNIRETIFNVDLTGEEDPGYRLQCVEVRLKAAR